MCIYAFIYQFDYNDCIRETLIDTDSESEYDSVYNKTKLGTVAGPEQGILTQDLDAITVRGLIGKAPLFCLQPSSLLSNQMSLFVD